MLGARRLEHLDPDLAGTRLGMIAQPLGVDVGVGMGGLLGMTHLVTLRVGGFRARQNPTSSRGAGLGCQGEGVAGRHSVRAGRT